MIEKLTEGFNLIRCMAMTFVAQELDIALAVHGDDFVAEGVRESLDILDDIMNRHFEVKRLPRIGPPLHGGEVTEGLHLRCKEAAENEDFQNIRKLGLQGGREGGPRPG